MATFEVYPDKAGEYRWRKLGENQADVVADSGEGYANRVDALSMAAKFGDPGDVIRVLDADGNTARSGYVDDDAVDFGDGDGSGDGSA